MFAVLVMLRTMTNDDAISLIAERNRVATRAALHAPRLSRAGLIAATRVPPATLAGWINRAALTLDADAGREPGAHRRFSALDAARVAVAAELSALGIGAGRAVAAAEAVGSAIEAFAELAASGARPLFDPRGVLLVDTRGRVPRVFVAEGAPEAGALIAVRPWAIIERAAAMIGDPLILHMPRAA
jgi:hypothetical protein